MKRTLRKELYRPRSRRINTNAELRKTTLLRNNLSRTFNRKLITTFNSFVREETDALDNSQSFVIEKAVRNLNDKLTPLFESEYRKVFSIVYRNNEKKYEQDKKQDGTVFGRNVYLDPVIKKFLEDRSRIFSGITIQMSRKLRDIIAQEFESGQTLPQITSAIRKEFGFFSRRRANLIARTETHTALGFANHDYHKNFQADTGITMLKRWRATNDARTRSFHSEANGQTVPMDEKFTVGGAEMDYVGDPAGGAKNVINCRCVVIYVDEQDVVDGVPATEVKPDNPFGDTDSVELTYHKDALWDRGEDNVLGVVKRSSPLSGSVNTKSSTSFFRPKDRSITMNSDYGLSKTNSVWRHEFGHAIDTDEKFINFINNLDDDVRKNLGFTNVDITNMNKTRNISALITRKIAADSKKLDVINKANKQKFGLEVYNDKSVGIGSGMTNARNSFLKKFGLNKEKILTDDTGQFLNISDSGKYVKITKADFKKKIRAYLKDTNGFIDTKFLDDVISAGNGGINPFTDKDWVDTLISKLSFEDDILRIDYFTDDLLGKLASIKNNANFKDSSFYEDIYNLFKDTGTMVSSNEEWLMFSDFVGSVSNNIVGKGHSDFYYGQFSKLLGGITNGNTTEAIANYTTLMSSGHSAFYRKLLEELIPETMKAFDDLFELLNQI
tara:strand:+ start:13820 stop:15826 length:2007 start_codon:yes stop_codon:yes gene_type:complete